MLKAFQTTQNNNKFHKIDNNDDGNIYYHCKRIKLVLKRLIFQVEM